MQLNKETAVVTPKVLLVPYEPHHVPTYHEWMKSEELQELTASEPLSLESEYEMQKSWREDTNKLTFIVCRHPFVPSLDSPKPEIDQEVVEAGKQDNPAYMIGDVNLFLNLEYEQDDNGDEDVGKPCVRGEIELMIASKGDRGSGYGKAALLAFLKYVKVHETEIVDIYMGDRKEEVGNGRRASEIRLGVKIGEDNGTSRRLFGSVGFEQVGEANYFREVEYRLADLGRVEDVEGWEEKMYISEGSQRIPGTS